MGSRHAVVVSYLALFVALGGTATAIQQRLVRARDLAANSVGVRALAPNSVGSKDIRSDVIGGRQLRDGGVGRDDLRSRSVESQAIADGTIRQEDLSQDLRQISLTQEQGIAADPTGMSLTSGRIEWHVNRGDTAPITFESSPFGGGGLLLDGSLGPNSGYIRLSETAGVPDPFTNAASLFVRDNGAGKTQLAVVFSDGTVVPLATAP